MSKFMKIHAITGKQSDLDYQDYIINTDKIRWFNPLTYVLEYEDKSFKILGRDVPDLIVRLLNPKETK